MAFDPEYVSQVLSENFEDAKNLFLSPLLAIHYAHLIMLRERDIVSEADARTLRAALDSIELADVKAAPYDGVCEDLYFYIDRILVRACGDTVAGRLHTARSRNDIDMTMYRMCQREFIIGLVAAVLELRQALLDLATRHRETVFAAHTHTQPAQPTTIAHYFLAIIEQLERDVTRLRAAFASTNRSPLGSCAITGTGFAIDRQVTSDLLGFDAPSGNTYGSIATVDYLLESVSAANVLLAGLGRVVQNLLLWCTAEFGYLRLADGLVQGSSIMPQKRNPVALEHARAIASKALGQGIAVFISVHNTPFGDIVDTEDDLQPLVASAFRDARRAVALVSASMRGAELDVARLESRAGEGGTTLTELADHLVRAHGIPFATAHAIASTFLQSRRQTPAAAPSAMLARASADVLGSPLQYDDEQIARITSPRHFVDIRRTPGGPAPAETTRAIALSHDVLGRDRAWLDKTHEALHDADARRRQRAQML
jgi:argininosuccinate lyase